MSATEPIRHQLSWQRVKHTHTHTYTLTNCMRVRADSGRVRPTQKHNKLLLSLCVCVWGGERGSTTQMHEELKQLSNTATPAFPRYNFACLAYVRARMP